MTPSPTDHRGGDSISPDEAFALLGNRTRIGILQALWDRFESGPNDHPVSYSTLLEAVDIEDSGNFSYHLEKLTDSFVRSTDEGYTLKQTGINVVRAVVTGTVTTDPSFGPTPVAVDCPICSSSIEVTYADELMAATCTECEGLLAWDDASGFIFGGLVPPAVMYQRPVEAAFRAGVTFVTYQIAALHDGVCPHCGGVPEQHLEVCTDHQPKTSGHCTNCNRLHQAEALMGCETCKWSVFPPASVSILTEPMVVAFYQDCGIEHRFATWEGIARSFDVDEEVVSREPLQLRLRVSAGENSLDLVIDEQLNVVGSST